MLHSLFQTTLLNQYRYEGPDFGVFDLTYNAYTFREIFSEDFLNHAIFSIKDRTKRYLDHLSKGHQCFGFENDRGDIISYFWLTIGDAYTNKAVPIFHGSACLFGELEAYIWDCRTVDEYRRQGLYKEGIKRLLQYCQQKNVQNIMMSCHASNRVSHLGIVSAGFTDCGQTRFIGLAGRVKVINSKRRKIWFSRFLSPVKTTDIFPGCT